MDLMSMIVNNVWRQKTRTMLTILGISIGIATILTLGAVADGMKESFGGVLKAGQADFSIAQAGASDLSFSEVDEALIEDVRELEGIKEVEGVLMGITQYGDNPYFFAFGVTEKGAKLGQYGVSEGRMFKPRKDEIVMGGIGADNADKRVGQSIRLFGRKFKVVGIYETGDTMRDGGAIVPLDVLQDATQKKGKVTMALAQTTADADVDKLTALIDRKWEEELTTIKSVDEVSRVDQGTAMLDGLTVGISGLAIIIGGIGVMNTLIISVYDRIREIGVLKALGWRRFSVVRMVVGEAVILGVASVVIASAFAVGLLEFMMLSPVLAGFFTPKYSVGLWVQATVVAVLVSLIGSLYPAFKAAGLSPVEALRYE